MSAVIESVPRGTTLGGPIAARLVATTMLTRGDPGYDEARTVWNAMVDRHPRIIARCAGPDDVMAAVRAARA